LEAGGASGFVEFGDFDGGVCGEGFCCWGVGLDFCYLWADIKVRDVTTR
jgi:hypothetical protein